MDRHDGMFSYDGGKTKESGNSKLNKDRLEGGFYCDVTIKLKDKEIKGHRTVLGPASEFFDTMFKSKMKESMTLCVDLTNLNSKAVESVINFIYTSSIDFSMENVYDIIHVADFMQIAELRNVGEACLQENIDGSNAIKILLFSTTYRLWALNRDVSKYLNDNLKDIEINEEFYNLTFEQVENLISQRNKEVTQEKTVYKVLSYWVNHDRLHREKYFEAAMQIMDFNLLEASFLKKISMNDDLFSKSWVCQKLLTASLFHHLGLDDNTEEEENSPHARTTDFIKEQSKKEYDEFMKLCSPQAQQTAGNGLSFDPTKPCFIFGATNPTPAFSNQQSFTFSTAPNQQNADVLISKKWLKKYEDYLTLGMQKGVVRLPGRVDNSDLYEDSKAKIFKPNLQKDIDYSLVKPPVWDFIVKQHGTEWTTEKYCPQNGDIYSNLILKVTTDDTSILNHCASHNITLPITLSMQKNQTFKYLVNQFFNEIGFRVGQTNAIQRYIDYDCVLMIDGLERAVVPVRLVSYKGFPHVRDNQQRSNGIIGDYARCGQLIVIR